MHRITRVAILCLIKRNIKDIDRDDMVFRLEDVGIRSNQSACFVDMYLSNVPIYIIILIKCWPSDAFLICIQNKFEEFTKGVSNKILLAGD